jgi:lysyl-tRNA synthetase class 2
VPPVDSSIVKAIQYDALAQTLTVRVVNGLYVYEDVPESVYRAFLAAPSKGAFYNAEVRDKFFFRR